MRAHLQRLPAGGRTCQSTSSSTSNDSQPCAAPGEATEAYRRDTAAASGVQDACSGGSGGSGGSGAEEGEGGDAGGTCTEVGEAAWMLEARRHATVEQWFHALVRAHFKGNTKPPFNKAAREQAGFTQAWYMPLAE